MESFGKYMSITEADFYRVAVQGIKKDVFFDWLGINEEIYEKMLNHETVEFNVPCLDSDSDDGVGSAGGTGSVDGAGSVGDGELRKSVPARLIADENKIYTAMLFLDREPVEFSSNLCDADGQMSETIKESDMFLPGNKSKIWIRTFGTFDVFLDGVPIRFPSAKAKELLALLVDRRGGSLTAEQAIGYLWEDRAIDK